MGATSPRGGSDAASGVIVVALEPPGDDSASIRESRVRGEGAFPDTNLRTILPGRRAGADPACQMLKYLAAGWWTISALVDCSGSICQFSVRRHPIRAGSSREKSFSWSLMSGQAGYPNE